MSDWFTPGKLSVDLETHGPHSSQTHHSKKSLDGRVDRVRFSLL